MIMTIINKRTQGSERPGAMLKLSALPLAVISAFLMQLTGAYPSSSFTQNINDNLFHFKTVQQLQFTSKYLQRYGYGTQFSKADDFTTALKHFQEDVGLLPSGRLDPATIAMMKRPRCGGKLLIKSSSRAKRFAHSSRWDKLTADNVLRLKWFISRYTNDMPVSEIRSIVKKSFNLWSTQTVIHSMPSVTLVFDEAKDEQDADITILWAEGDHGDEYKFDDAGDEINILAHTFYPNYHRGTLNGDIHLDDAETWTSDGRYGGTTFANVFIHEIGHALGLGHSKQEEAIMFPVYKKHPRDHEHFDLDDKCAINWNYIGPSNTCLFVWIMSEIVKHQVDHSSKNGVVANSVAITTKDGKETHEERLLELKERLRKTPIPRCKETNDVQQKLTHRLLHELNIAPEFAHKYSKLSCEFLNGLHREFHERLSTKFTPKIFGENFATKLPLLLRDKRHLKKRLRHSRNRNYSNRRHLIDVNADTFNEEFFTQFLSLYTE